MDLKLKDEIEAFLRAEGRDRRLLWKGLRPQLRSREHAALVAPAVRDPSPKLSARVTSLLAQYDLEDLFEAQLAGLKAGKVSILRRHFQKIQRARGES